MTPDKAFRDRVRGGRNLLSEDTVGTIGEDVEVDLRVWTLLLNRLNQEHCSEDAVVGNTLCRSAVPLARGALLSMHGQLDPAHARPLRTSRSP